MTKEEQDMDIKSIEVGCECHCHCNPYGGLRCQPVTDGFAACCVRRILKENA